MTCSNLQLSTACATGTGDPYSCAPMTVFDCWKAGDVLGFWGGRGWGGGGGGVDYYAPGGCWPGITLYADICTYV